MMIAAYAAQMAPGGRIVVAATFQAAMRLGAWNAWLTPIAGRSNWLSRASPMTANLFGKIDPLWQPLPPVRKLRALLVTYDWGEAFVAPESGPQTDDRQPFHETHGAIWRSARTITCSARYSTRSTKTANGTANGAGLSPKLRSKILQPTAKSSRPG